MASIHVKNLTKTFKNVKALDAVDLEIRDGEFFCILGQPGAGKTTLLRSIVGLEKPDSGEILLDGKIVNHLHPSKRDIAMMFQNLALYPDKTVFNNIAFPLRQQKVPESEIKTRVEAVAKQLKIDWLLEKIPSKLSGGERQRVAIGRAIIRQPRAYLMDEPLSNLDALLRLEMRVSLKELQTTLKETFVYVTHDQVEALSMGDRIAVMKKGRVQQVADPETIYGYPVNMFVATIVGNPPMNFIPCTVEAHDGRVTLRHPAFALSGGGAGFSEALIKASEGSPAQRSVYLGVRPEDITFERERAEHTIPGQIFVIEPLGNEKVIDVKVGEQIVKVLADPEFPGLPGEKVSLGINRRKLHFFDRETEICLHHGSEADGFSIG
jgi:ABC-type sugar transport system ATPase subunit